MLVHCEIRIEACHQLVYNQSRLSTSSTTPVLELVTYNGITLATTELEMPLAVISYLEIGCDVINTHMC